MQSTHRSVLAAAAAALALFSAQGARADDDTTSYVLALTGTAHHSPDCWENLAACPPDGAPTLHDVTYPWTGTITVTVNDSDNGTYSAAAFQSLAIDTNVTGQYALTGFSLYGDSVTIQHHRVTSLDVEYQFPFGNGGPITIDFDGLNVAYNQAPQHHYGETDAVGVLTPIPEPSTYALFGAGLLGVAMRTRRRGTSGRSR